MNREEAEELTQAVGQSVSGAWRTIAALKRLGVPKALGLTTEEWVTKRLGGYVKLSIAERRDAVAELKAEGASNREIAGVLGVAEGTVRNDAAAQNCAPADEDAAPDQAFDEENAQNYAPSGLILDDGIDPDPFDPDEDQDLPRDEDGSPVYEETGNPIDAVAALAATDAARKLIADASGNNHRAMGTGENEWYTPAEYIAAAREVMGGIDLDPASSELANRTVQAARYFTVADNGLAHDWHGRVWMNPPYSQPAISHFAEKMVAEVSAGNVEHAIALTHNYTDTAWFHTMASIADAICFTRGRIGFVDREGNKAAPTQGQAFFYYGPDRDAFASVFSAHGIVMVRT